MQDRTHNATFGSFPMRTLRQCHVNHTYPFESTLSVEHGTGGGKGKSEMDTVTSPGILSR